MDDKYFEELLALQQQTTISFMATEINALNISVAHRDQFEEYLINTRASICSQAPAY